MFLLIGLNGVNGMCSLDIGLTGKAFTPSFYSFDANAAAPAERASDELFLELYV